VACIVRNPLGQPIELVEVMRATSAIGDARTIAQLPFSAPWRRERQERGPSLSNLFIAQQTV